MPSPTSRFWGRLASLILAGFILWVDYGALRDQLAAPSFAQQQRERAEMATWPSVPGRLEKLHVAAVSLPRQMTSYVARGEYRYEVDGKGYRGTRLSIDGTAFDSDYYADFKKKVATLVPDLKVSAPESRTSIDYAADQPVTVHYDPRNPERSILNNKDARPLVWLMEVALPWHFMAGFAVFALALVATAFRRPGTSPGVLRTGDTGDVVYGERWPWLSAVNGAGPLLIGAAAGTLLNAFTPVPGESVGCFTAVFVGGFGVLLLLCGVVTTLLLRFEVLVCPADRSVQRLYRHGLLSFLPIRSKPVPLSDYDHIEWSVKEATRKGIVEWDVFLVGKHRLHVCSDSTGEAAGQACAGHLGKTTGLPLTRVTPSADPPRAGRPG